MKARRGITLIEVIVVISIIGILLGATAFRMAGTSQANDLEMATNLVQSALNQAREMARSPRPSGDINSDWDVNGYGVVFDYNGKNKFSVFSDIVDKNNPENQNIWINPQDTNIDDKILRTYDFHENHIKGVEIEKYIIDGTDIYSGLPGPQSFVFLYSEKPQEEKVYFNGNVYVSVSVILKNESGDRREIRVNFKSGIIEVI